MPASSRSATLLVVCTAHFLMPFMMSAVGVALPAIGAEFKASALQLGLVESAYVTSAAIFLLTMGRLGDIHGRCRIFNGGLILFTLLAAAISQAWSIESIIVLRFVQGIGGAMVMATSLALVVAAYPAEERGRALGVTVASVYAGISCGPFIGGAIVGHWGWRWLFYLCVPLSIVALIIALLRLRCDLPAAAGEPFDRRGSLMYGGAILLLLGGASNLDRGGWAIGLATVGLAALGLFLRQQARTPYPLLDVRLLRENRVFALSNLAALLNYAATFGVAFFLSLYLQYVKGLSPQQAGLVLIIQPSVQTLLSPLCGYLADRFAAARVASAGMALCAVGLAVAASLTAESSFAVIVVMLVLLGIGFALFSSPNTSVIMGSVPPRHLGVASGLTATMRTLGMMTCMTIITVIFSVVMQGAPVTATTLPDFLHSMRLAFVIFCALCLCGIFASLARLRRS